jgi:pyridoxine 5-phosphate synthase
VTVQISGHPPAVPPSFNIGRFRCLARRLLHICGAAENNLSIHLVDDPEIARLNGRYRFKKSATNVLAFPFGDGAGEELHLLPVRELGDIIISIDTAAREAAEYGQSFYDRMSWLLVHGLLHLLGHDHERSEEDARIMFDRENQIMRKLEQSRRPQMTQLAINVDHIATIRQARGINEPDPVTGAAICELAGAAGIVVHLREDRRHIQDRDVYLLRDTVKTKLNLEMGANKEIIKIALEVRPDLVTLVPEKRQELTTEGGLDTVSQQKKIAKVIEKMSARSIPVSIFSDPDPAQLKAARDVGATYVELHTGRYCDATSEEEQEKEFKLIGDAAEEAAALGLRVCAGHGLNYRNTGPIAALDTIEELSIGHAIMARAIFCGLDQAVREMLAIVRENSYIY